MDKNWRIGDIAQHIGGSKGIVLEAERAKTGMGHWLLVLFFYDAKKSLAGRKLRYHDGETNNLGPATDLERILYGISSDTY